MTEELSANTQLPAGNSLVRCLYSSPMAVTALIIFLGVRNQVIYAESPANNREPMSEQIFEKVKGIVAEQLSVDEEKVTPEAHFQNDLQADSLDVVEMVMALEEEFEIEIPDEAAEDIQTVQAAVDYISAKAPA